MGAGHGHGHGHSDGRGGVETASGRHRTRLMISFAMVATFFVVELLAGIVTGSLALVSDAGHMAADVVALGAALVATRIATRLAPRLAPGLGRGLRRSIGAGIGLGADREALRLFGGAFLGRPTFVRIRVAIVRRPRTRVVRVTAFADRVAHRWSRAVRAAGRALGR